MVTVTKSASMRTVARGGGATGRGGDARAIGWGVDDVPEVW